MPFKSKAQAKYLFAKEPEVAKEFAEHTSKQEFSRLPDHAKKNKHLKELSKKHLKK